MKYAKSIIGFVVLVLWVMISVIVAISKGRKFFGEVKIDYGLLKESYREILSGEWDWI